MYRILLFSLFFLFASQMNVEAAKKKPFSSQADAEQYLTTHYNRGCRFFNQENWRSAMDEFEKVIHFFPHSTEAAEAYYFLGICYFQKNEFDFANKAFSNYLTASVEPPYFEDAVYYKFCIAEHFRLGKRRRPLTYRYFPKWLPGETLALTIYDEVAIALPNHELTLSALYAKGQLLQKMGDFHEAIDTYQILIRRFPRHELTPSFYLNIAESYCQQSLYEFQNPDLLALAELNVRKFEEDFPRDERISLAEGYVCRMKEMYAKGLCDVGCFYERVGQPEAAVIYYESSMNEFPDTSVARYCKGRLRSLGRLVEPEEDRSCMTIEQETSEDAPSPGFEGLNMTDFSENNDQQLILFQSEEGNGMEQMPQEPVAYPYQTDGYNPSLAQEESWGGNGYMQSQPIEIPVYMEEKEETPVPYYLHYSLLKKRQTQEKRHSHH
ncbi:MAG: tetratricopeptide repeat protein [Parachlamydia sp.]|jgi:outer membrane protein assembly factor BamD (BamD/ComL family)|nr:tetratricopeptide repeat protein [Parachlamydia sp.]